MGLTYNGVEPDEITYNGQPVDSVTYNGVEVWSAELPMTNNILEFNNKSDYDQQFKRFSNVYIDGNDFYGFVDNLTSPNRYLSYVKNGVVNVLSYSFYDCLLGVLIKKINNDFIFVGNIKETSTGSFTPYLLKVNTQNNTITLYTAQALIYDDVSFATKYKYADLIAEKCYMAPWATKTGDIINVTEFDVNDIITNNRLTNPTIYPKNAEDLRGKSLSSDTCTFLKTATGFYLIYAKSGEVIISKPDGNILKATVPVDPQAPSDPGYGFYVSNDETCLFLFNVKSQISGRTTALYKVPLTKRSGTVTPVDITNQIQNWNTYFVPYTNFADVFQLNSKCFNNSPCLIGFNEIAP